jgi:hypothetical protein
VVLHQLPDGSYEHQFYGSEAMNLTGFQLELKGKSGDITGIIPSSAIQSTLTTDYNLKLSPGVIRIVSSPKSALDCPLKSGDLWFTIYTKSSVKLYPSYSGNFRHEYIFNSASQFYTNTEVVYSTSTLKGESVRLSQDQKSQVIIESHSDLKKIEIVTLSDLVQMSMMKPIGDRRMVIDTNNWIPGLYLARIQLANGHIETKKFIVF